MENSDIKILIVENELMIAHAIKAMLEDLNYNNVHLVFDKTNAEKVLSTETFDIVSLDINLFKGGEGYELASICRRKKIPFFYLTSYSDEKNLNLALQTNPAAFLTKPIRIAQLHTTIQISVQNKLTDQAEEIIVFDDNNSKLQIQLTDIMYFKSSNIYVEIITSHSKFLIRSKLKNIIDYSPINFIQVHRSYVVNKQNVLRLNKKLEMKNGDLIPISRSFKNEFTL